MKIKLLLSSIIFASTLFPSKANILAVPSSYASIQAAILASSNGDTVLVDPGIYFENINFRGHKIVLTSKYFLSGDTSYICSTIINGSQPLNADTASCILIINGEDSSTVVQGFTLTAGAGTRWLDEHGAGYYREGGGVLTASASPIIRNNYILNNWITNTTGVSSTGGGGIRCGDGHPQIYNNVIAFNKARYGCGIVLNFCDSAQVKNNLIAHNSGGQAYGGGGIWINGANTGSTIYVDNNTIVYNRVSGSSGLSGKAGAILVQAQTLIAKNNLMWGNVQTAGLPIRNQAGVVSISFSDLDFSFAGSGNFNANPLFIDSLTYAIGANSPCIDAGDSSLIYNDKIDSSGLVLYPSQGTFRNDVGASGGSRAAIFAQCAGLSLGLEKESTSFSIQLYPNPAQADFTVSAGNETIKKVEVISTLGCILKTYYPEHTSLALHGKDFQPGMYFLNIELRNKIVIKKIQIL